MFIFIVTCISKKTVNYTNNYNLLSNLALIIDNVNYITNSNNKKNFDLYTIKY